MVSLEAVGITLAGSQCQNLTASQSKYPVQRAPPSAPSILSGAHGASAKKSPMLTPTITNKVELASLQFDPARSKCTLFCNLLIFCPKVGYELCEVTM